MKLPTVAAFNIKENAEVSRAISLAVPIGAIVASLLIIGFVIWPKIHEIFVLKENNKQLVTRADNLEKKASILASLDKNKLEEQLVASEQLLPSDKNVFSILRQIEASASQTGVLLNKVEAVTGTINQANTLAPTTVPAVPTPGQGAGLDLAPKVEVRLSIVSDYASLLKFLSSIYAFSRVISIDSITLSASVGESLQLRSNFSVSAYWKSLPAELGSVESQVEKLVSSEEQLLAKVSTPEVSQAPTVPTVPVGRTDLFTPF